MKVFIANFGRENLLWPACKATSTISTYEDDDTWPLLNAGDRDGYIAHAMAHKRTARGISPPKPVASRWFNLAKVVSMTQEDLWIHREKEELWWTTSRAGAVQVTRELNDRSRSSTIFMRHA